MKDSFQGCGLDSTSQWLPAVYLLVPFPLHLGLIDTRDVTLVALCEVRHTSELPVIVVDFVLGMLSLNELCEENTSNSRPVILDFRGSKVLSRTG